MILVKREQFLGLCLSAIATDPVEGATLTASFVIESRANEFFKNFRSRIAEKSPGVSFGPVSGCLTVAVYSEADRKAPFVSEADEAVCIGAAESSESYLNIERVLRAVNESGADGPHPGYGFLL